MKSCSQCKKYEAEIAHLKKVIEVYGRGVAEMRTIFTQWQEQRKESDAIRL